MWGSDVDFSIFRARNVWVRTPWDGHRFVMRGNLGWIETNNFDKVPPDLRFFAGGDGSIRVTVTTKSHRKILTAN